MVSNILNNQKIVTGGFEQSRSSYTTKEENGQTVKNKDRSYKFPPMKFYVMGINGMLNVAYKF